MLLGSLCGKEAFNMDKRIMLICVLVVLALIALVVLETVDFTGCGHVKTNDNAREWKGYMVAKQLPPKVKVPNPAEPDRLTVYIEEHSPDAFMEQKNPEHAFDLRFQGVEPFYKD